MKIIKYRKKYISLSQNFSCGNIILDNFIKSNDALNPSIGTTYILLNEEKKFYYWLL